MEELKSYLKAAAVLSGVLERAKKTKAGEPIAVVAESLEREIFERGARPAFPINISINEVAAHDTAGVEDARTIPERAVVKIDCGVHIDGFIVDAALTIDLSGEWGRLCEAAEAALNSAVSIIKDGVKISDIGRTIEEKIKLFGYKPISNLTGHAMRRWELHTGIEIPNYWVRSERRLHEGDIVAIEPFCTNGAGYVVESGRCEIYSQITERSFRTKGAKEIFEKIKSYRKLPFAQRWCVRTFEERAAFQEILKSGALKSYPVLRESARGIVAQAEHTIVVEKESALVLV